jgi:DNA-binding response OmpR family regulator
MKILIIEDNSRLSDRIVHHLNKTYTFEICRNGEDALTRVGYETYGLIILDLGLPDINGLDICTELRKQGVHTPILILTGEDNISTKVELLRSGADDYMTKPFDISELHARIQVLSRRASRQKEIRRAYHHKDLTLNPESREVFREESALTLRRKEFDILECLLVNKGQIMTRESIMSYAWDTASNSWTSTVDVHVKHLRDKVDKPYKEKYIETVYGIGYRINKV